MNPPAPYTARAHWAWFRSCAPVRERIEDLAEQGRKPRRNGLAWCTVDATTPRDVIGSYERYVEWERSINSLASVVPPSLREAVRPLVALNPDLEVAVPPGRSIKDPERVAQLQQDCLRRVKRAPIDPRARDSERKRISSALAVIDPGRSPVIPVPQREHARPVAVGEFVTTSATQAASGRVSSFPSQVGYPIVGLAASQTPAGVSIVTPAARPELPRASPAALAEGFLEPHRRYPDRTYPDRTYPDRTYPAARPRAQRRPVLRWRAGPETPSGGLSRI
jgi:hypothetical protein